MENEKKLKKLQKFWSGKKIFITGHTGFKGTWLCIMLNLLKSEIYGYSLNPKRKSLFNESKIHNFLKSNTFSDINNISLLKKKLKLSKPQIVFHLAAQSLVLKSYENPVETFRTNIMGTVNLLNCIRKVNTIKSVVIVTTDKVYKVDKKNKIFNELDILGGSEPYSASKVGAELATESFIKSFFQKTHLKNKISTARSGNVIGGGDYSKNRLIPDIFRAIENKKKLIIRNPNSIRPWQHILDTLNGYIILAEKITKYKRKYSGAWNFGPNYRNIKTVELIAKKIKLNWYKKTKSKIIIRKNKDYEESKSIRLNCNKAKKYLKWSPKLNIDNAIKYTIDWHNNNKLFNNSYNQCIEQIKSFEKIK